MKLLKDYQKVFFGDDFIEKIKKENNNYLKEIFKRNDYLLNGEIIFTDSMDMESTFIPYKINEYKWKSTPNGDNEWCFMLSRHGYTLDLAISYILTKDDKYLSKWKELVFSFIKEEGIPKDENKICWRPLDTGLRLGFWVRSLVFLGRESFTEIEWETLLEAIEIHKKHLTSTFVNKYLLSNWGVLALSGFILTILFEEDSIKKYIDIWEKLKTTIELQFSEKGVQWEQSPLYHHEVIFNYTLILQMSESLNLELPINLREILKKFVEASYYMCDQKDYLLALNDSDYVDFSYVYDFYRGMDLLNDKDINYLKNLKAKILLGNYYMSKINHCQFKNYNESFFDNTAGFVAIKDDKYYLTCFNGLHGSSHGQSSQGAITLNYEGRPILIDCGRFSYTECLERITLNRALSHNTVTLENLEGTVIKSSWNYDRLIEPLSIDIKEKENFSFIEMIWLANSGDRIATFRRHIILFKDIKTLLIVDDVKSNKEDNTEVYFHLGDFFDTQRRKDVLETEDILFYSDDKIEEFTHFHSPRYNSLKKHTAIKVTGKGLVLSMISLEKDIKIEKVPVYQNNQKEEFISCRGIKMSVGKIVKEVYINSSEIVKNDKLLIGNNNLFYGTVVVFENGKRIRVK